METVNNEPLIIPPLPEVISLTLKARHFGFINVFTPDKGKPEMVDIFNQVAAQLVLAIDEETGAKSVADPEQEITVEAKGEMVPNLFLAVGSQQERLATNYNNEMRQLLLPQIMEHPGLLYRIQQIMEQNARDTQALVNEGFKYFIAIKR